MGLERFNSHQVPNAWEENNSATADHQAVAACWSEGKQQLLYDFTTPPHFSATSQGISTSQRSWFFSATPLTSWKKGWGIQTGEPRLVFTLLLPRKSRNFHLTAACCSFTEMASAAPSCRGQTCRCRVNKQQHFAFVLFLSFWEQIQSLKGSVCFSRLFMHALLSALWGFCSLCSHGSFPQLQKGLGWGKKREKIKASAFTHEQNIV